MSGPRPPKSGVQLEKRDVNAMAECEAQWHDFQGIFDPRNGYFLYEGKDAEKIRHCLKTKYGWFELGPPEYNKGTMAPPR